MNEMDSPKNGASHNPQAAPPGGARDFDFLIGEWAIDNHRLVERLAGSDEGESFPATLAMRPALGGLGNVDAFHAERDGKAIEALTLRIFNPQTEMWSLYWVDNLTPVLQPPVVGKSVGGRGDFFAHDHHEGVPVLVRFLWTDISNDSARWAQAFSVDEGESWGTNWGMTFTRLDPAG